MSYSLPCPAPNEGITGWEKAHKSILRNDPNSNHERSGAMTGMEVFTIDADKTGFTLDIASLSAPHYIKFCVKGAGANLAVTLTSN